MIKIIIGVVIAAIVVITAFMLIDPALNTNSGDGVSLVSTVDGIKVGVEGQVLKTGTYVLSEGALMSDLIDIAGGVTDEADSLAYYLDAPLSANATYYIAPKYDASDICTQTEIKKVNVNIDDVETLTTISGITTSIANSIVSYRNENEMFYTIEDLKNVYGVGEATYKNIRNYVILHD